VAVHPKYWNAYISRSGLRNDDVVCHILKRPSAVALGGEEGKKRVNNNNNNNNNNN